MTLLPIVQRELMDASRRRNTYWIRVGMAGAGLFIGAWMLVFPENRSPSQIGMVLFIPLTIVALLYCAFVGVFRTSDCLSEEKREGTLGLLFLTDLKGYDIVLGKLAATSLNAVYGWLALVPVLAVPLLTGGVSIEEFGRVVLVSLNTLFFSLAVGMFCSAINREERWAMVWALSVMLFFVLGLPIAAAIVEDTLQWRKTGLAEWIAVPSPSFAAALAFDDLRRGGAPGRYFLPSVLCIHLLAWLCLVASALIVPRTWQDRPLNAATVRRRERWAGEAGGGPVRRAAQRRRLLAINPMLWLVTRGRFRMAGVWALFGLGAVIWLFGLSAEPQDWKDEFAYVTTSLAAHLVLKFWVVIEACRRFSLDRQSGALELLLSTPWPEREIVRGQVHGIERLFAGPVLVVLTVDFIFLLASRQESGWGQFWAVWMLVFLADMFTLTWLGMWRGLNSRRPNRAVAASLAQVLVLPWVVIGLIMTVLGVSEVFHRFHSAFWEAYGFPLLYLTVGLAVDLWYGWPARWQLLHRFRRVAAEQFERRS